MHSVMLAIHVAALNACFYAILIIARQKNKERSNYMIATMICNVVTMVGYILELTSDEIPAMVVAVKMEYLGKVFEGTFLLFTFIRYYKWKFSDALMYVLWAIDVVMFFIILTCDKHSLYYSSISLMNVDGHNYISLGKTPLYIMFMVYMQLELLLFTLLCYKNSKDAVGNDKKIQTRLVIASIIANVSIIISITGVVAPFDLVPLIITMLAVFVAVLIKRYGLFSTLELAKENLITSLNEGIIVINWDGSLQYANSMAYEMFPEMIGRKNDDLRQFIQYIYEKSKCEIYNKDGKYYQIKNKDLYDRDMVVGNIITVIDITSLHESNKEMEQLKIEADNANRAKSNFLANMSHEIRTPINAVLGMDEMILRETEEENTREYAENIKRAGETLLSLVSDILDFSKIESGKMSLVKSDYILKSLINDIVSTFSIKMTEKGLSFEVEADKNMPSVLHGDEMKIKQVLINLLSNACKYTNEGYVKFIVKGVWRDEEFFVEMAVEDTGIGIKKENVDRLFESFARVDEKKNRNIEGTGLGLNITKNLLNMMESDLKVESEYGKGSRFSFIISQKVVDEKPMGDISEHAVRKEEKEKRRNEFVAPDAKILVVDDNGINLTVMKGLLKKLKVQVDTATSGVECLEMAKRKKYHVIFMDHLMPDMDGIETLHNMQGLKDNMNGDTPVVALTANAVSGAREIYLEEGFDDYMTKPINVKILEEMIRRLLPEELIF